MNMMIIVWAAAAIAALGAGCTPRPQGKGATPRKVGDQLLAVYTPLRRLSYRNACGSSRDITICVDRISISDSVTLVETRLSNASRSGFSLTTTDEAAILVNQAGERVVGESRDGKYLRPGDTTMRFRLEGHLAGEPAALTVNAGEAGREVSIIVGLCT
jgi:hypothetical protein